MSDDLVNDLRKVANVELMAFSAEKRAGLLLKAADRIKALEAALERQQISYGREREIDQEEIDRLIALRRDDAEMLERIRALIAEAEVIAEYGRDDGLRDWVDVGAWLSPGDRIVVLPGQQ